jgi:transcriptional regulator with XRE-family HTH domain
MKTMNYVVADIKEVRKKLEIKLIEMNIKGGISALAELAGFEYVTLLMKVQGKRKFDLKDASKIANALNVSVEEIFFDIQPNE